MCVCVCVCVCVFVCVCVCVCVLRLMLCCDVGGQNRNSYFFPYGQRPFFKPPPVISVFPSLSAFAFLSPPLSPSLSFSHTPSSHLFILSLSLSLFVSLSLSLSLSLSCSLSF